MEKLGALVIAARYKDKKKRLQPVSPSLAKLTLLHSANHRNWEKSSVCKTHIARIDRNQVRMWLALTHNMFQKDRELLNNPTRLGYDFCVP